LPDFSDAGELTSISILIRASGFSLSSAAPTDWNVGKTISIAAAAPSQSTLRRESTGLVWLVGTSIVSRRRQKVFSCGFMPASIDVAQGPYCFAMTLLLSGTVWL
jgi:hypothetical protein